MRALRMSALTTTSTAATASTATATPRISSASATSCCSAAVAVVSDVRVARQVVNVGPTAVIQHSHLTIVLVNWLHLQM